MLLRIANRHNGMLTIQAGQEHEDYFKLGAAFTVARIDDTIVAAKEPNGTSVCREPNAYRCSGFTRLICSSAAGAGLPSFCVDEAEFVEEDDFIVWQIPPYYELPWTQRASRDPECVRHNLSLRIKAAVAAGVARDVVTKAVPAWARSVLTGREWMEIVDPV